MKNADDLPILSFESQKDWEAWLHEHHTDPKGIWLKIAKKDSGILSVDHAQALEGALCYGWIDGKRKSLDTQHFLQKFTPRGRKSIWSKINRDKVTALIAEGRMQPAGLRQVELSQADGRWDAAYDSQSKIEVPEDLQRELDRHPAARDFFGTLNSANLYAILFRVTTAKKPETRAARIKKFVEMLEKGEKLYP